MVSPSRLGEVTLGDIASPPGVASPVVDLADSSTAAKKRLSLVVSSLRRCQLLLTTGIRLQRRAVDAVFREARWLQLGIAGFRLEIRMNFADAFNGADLSKMETRPVILVRGTGRTCPAARGF